MKRNTLLLFASLLGTLVGLHFALSGSQVIVNSTDHQQTRRQQPINTLVSKKQALYDPDPNHTWNRLHRSLFVRIDRDGQEYGFDELDPLFWYETKRLLSGPSYQQAINSLDEFLSTNADRLIGDPLKR